MESLAATALQIFLASELVVALTAKLYCVISILCVYKSFLHLDTDCLVFLVLLYDRHILHNAFEGASYSIIQNKMKNRLQFMKVSSPPRNLLIRILGLRAILSRLFHSQE